METQGTAKKTIKDWRKQGLGWVPDYPDVRDYPLDEEVQKSSNPKTNSGNLKRNEVTKSLEDIAENLIEVLEILEEEFPGKETLKKIKTKLKQQVLDEFHFVKVKVFEKSLRLGMETPEVRQLKYYFQFLSLNPNFSKDFNVKHRFFGGDYRKYLQWMNDLKYNEETEKIVKEFQKLVKIKEDGIVGLETYTAIGKYLNDSTLPLPTQDTPLVNLLPIPIWIQEGTFPLIFRTLKLWWGEFKKGEFKEGEFKEGEVNKALKGLLDQENPENSKKFFQILKQEFFLIEPIASVITGKISPFAIHDDLHSSVEKALNDFHDCDINKPENSYIKGALFEVKKRINNAKKERKSNPKKPDNREDLGSGAQVRFFVFSILMQAGLYRLASLLLQDYQDLNMTFYDFLLPIVEGYITKSNSSVASEMSNEFAPKYLFEIFEDNVDKDSGKNSERDIVDRPELSVLVNRNWLEKHSQEENQKHYGLLPSFADLSFWCSPIRNQGDINSCTAFAGVALLEYFARRNKDESTYISPLFLYKVARNLMNSTGDVGASVRETMKAMVLFGVPPEKYWSYEEDKFDEEPPAFCYSYAQSYKTLKYFRLDRPELTKEILLFQIQAVLAAGFPCIFGFTVYSSIYKEENIDKGYIPCPSKGDQVAGGHTVLAVGYDNYKEIKHSNGKEKSTGAFLIRNSWGTEWGQKGYGWLPYDYVLKGLTADWWSLIKAEWFEAGNFGLGAYAPGNGGGKHQRVPPPPPPPPPKPPPKPTPTSTKKSK